MARSPRVRMPGEAPSIAAADPENDAIEDAGGPAAAEVQADDGLPDAASIDPSTLKKAVLTRQGWLCPNPPPDDGTRRQGFVG